MSFPRYPAYKDSGVEWLGTVPEYWSTCRVKDTTYLKGRVGWKGLKSDEYLESGYAYLVTGTDFDTKFISWAECYCIDKSRYDDDPFIQLRNGDLLITKDGTIGKLALVSGLDRPACLNSGIFLVRPQIYYTTEFMYWVLSSDSFRVFCDLGSMGSTIQHLYQNVFEKFVFPAPSIPEQTQISAFLDGETAKIDALVAEQRRLMALLKEKRQAVISHAVTRSLNPLAPMKPSGIDWLGDVPAHWTVASVRRVIRRIEQGWSPDCFGRPAEPDEWGVVKSGCVNRGVFVEQENKALPETLDPIPEYEIRAGDVLMSRASGSPELVGSTAYITATRPKLMLSDKIFRIHTEPSIDRKFFVAIFNSRVMRSQIERAISGADGLANNLPQSAMKGFFCVVPSIDEQQAIAAFLESESAKFDALTAEAQRAIDLLQERRTALVSAAVTGQIDVRSVGGAHERIQ